jgi:hypothetical protein
MKTLLSSKAFWTAVIDAVVGIVFLVIGQYAPEYDAIVKQVWLLLQPIVLALIAAFTTDELAVKVARVIRGL